MNPKLWGILSLVFVGLIAIGMDTDERNGFDPESLSPPAAGPIAISTQPKYNCEGVIYSISEDGVKYVRQSGGGVLLAAQVNNKVGFYRLGKFGSIMHANHTEMDAEVSERLEYALNNCNARHLPSGVYFALR